MLDLIKDRKTVAEFHLSSRECGIRDDTTVVDLSPVTHELSQLQSQVEHDFPSSQIYLDRKIDVDLLPILQGLLQLRPRVDLTPSSSLCYQRCGVWYCPSMVVLSLLLALKGAVRRPSGLKRQWSPLKAVVSAVPAVERHSYQ